VEEKIEMALVFGEVAAIIFEVIKRQSSSIGAIILNIPTEF
jgi:hypothetical protein